jgi:hypothetical protein
MKTMHFRVGGGRFTLTAMDDASQKVVVELCNLSPMPETPNNLLKLRSIVLDFLWAYDKDPRNIEFINRHRAMKSLCVLRSGSDSVVIAQTIPTNAN